MFDGGPAALPVPRARRSALYVPGHCPGGQTWGKLWAVRWILGRAGSAYEELTANPGRDAVVRVPELDLELPVLLVPAGLWSGTAGDPALKSAAAIIAGNAVAGLRPDSRWAIYEAGSPTVGNRRKQFDIDRLLDTLVWRGRSSSAGTYWRAGNVGPGIARESPLPMHLVPGSPAARQSRYMRPLLPAVTYYSDDGNSAPYGQQWREGVPAPDSYGVDSHPERFAGLHSAALALLEHLAGDYDVEVHGDPVHARDLLLDALDVLQAVKVTPGLPGLRRGRLYCPAIPVSHCTPGCCRVVHFPSAAAKHVTKQLGQQQIEWAPGARRRGGGSVKASLWAAADGANML